MPQEQAPQNETQTHDESYVIGYALEPKKIQNLIRPSLIDHAKKQGIHLIPIDINKPLIQQHPHLRFHCIIQKLQPKHWNNLNFHEYLSKHGANTTTTTIIIDPPHLVQKLQNRVSMLDSASQLPLSLQNATVGVPYQVVVDDEKKTKNSVEEMVMGSNLRFPVIAKPLYADGTMKSHELCLVFDAQGLRETLNKNAAGGAATPVVLQEFVNHGGVVFKVYVAGEHVRCVKRTSLPNIPEDKAKAGTLKFSQISNFTIQDNNVGDGANHLSNIERAEMPEESLIKELARALRERTGLNLFNIDVIRDAKDCTRYLVIDINYFPGYAKLPCYESFITDFLLDCVRNKAAVVCV
ncbi:inositol-tetrakisphosphate 1-kinase 1-like isoform X1 [Arachis ipaensis]|uniref:Inositol-tetrakisphosphate 1-kinase n=1 Tax=Arachis hypogaea TaxID=3818 RepID=A0A444X7N4_ARAHY|nr:inositol-tetrakisphosphate 1-kinase 1-like isoform X1 [Arachis ipaensis]XP_025684138.1 inositol-tetrakisphosphate 1-kinase 1 isoform X1 [Arachis hypogaea]QHN83418.1 Inositol-tetrakisphosphate 1-kinase [Arachis hypogaea]RYQ85706.1 hypothetical protein Ahy_B10g105296 [Arachis hypogaea]